MLKHRRCLKFLFLIIAVFIACTKVDIKQQVSDPSDFVDDIKGFTVGEISAHGEIAITLSEPAVSEDISTLLLFEFDPKVKGQSELINENVIVFTPNEPLKNDQEYKIQFNLGRVKNVPKEKEIFSFEVHTTKQDLEIVLGELESVDSKNMKFSGTIYTADKAWVKNISRVLNVSQVGNEELEISWDQNFSGTIHNFEVTGIVRGNKPSTLDLKWDGDPIGIKLKGSQSIEIIERSVFELLSSRVFTNSNPRVELTFSDKVDPSQNLDGLVRISNIDEINWIINGNKIILNPREIQTGEQRLTISSAIKNEAGKRLEEDLIRQIQFNPPKPQLELLGKGTIIPSSDNLLFPFKAVSLGAIDVRIIRVFENNIGQFLQDHQLGDNSSWRIDRVGRQVFGKAIPLSSLGTVEVGSWNNYALDLSNVIEPEPGALYKVELGFRKHQAVYDCGENDPETSADLSNRNWSLSFEDEVEYWNNYGNRRYPQGYDWQERDNPCHISYYYNQRNKTRNILASDLGIIAKRSSQGKTKVFVTDLKSTELLRGVQVDIFDFQQQKLGSALTGTNGEVELETEREPYYLMGSLGDQKGYLRLDEGSSLSVSDFDVSGAQVQKGVKGFLYGERGVWRPGDTLFVSFILEDENNVLPKDHPVSFELRNPAGQLVDRKTFTSSLNGFYVYEGSTEKQAPTGNWSLSAKVGGLTFNRSIKIETVKPNRLKVELDFDEDFISSENRKLNATLSSRWLHGAIARSLKADVEMSLSRSSPEYPEYPDYSFNDESISFFNTPVRIFEGNLDKEGREKLDYEFKTMKQGPGKVRVNLRTRVFEPSGNFSVGSATTYYYPFETLVGLKSPKVDGDRYSNWLSRNEDHSFEVVSLNSAGELVPDQELQYEVYNIRWRWWWERSSEDLSNYFERQNIDRIKTGSLTTDAEGRGSFNVNISNRDGGGRYLVRVKDIKEGHSASQIVYFSWYGGRGSGVSPARLAFSSDKEKYEVGEKVTLTIPSSSESKILVSLETGSKIISTQWIEGKKGSTEYTFETSGEMSPNIYANVMHVQNHGQEENDLPLRMYGVIPIEVEDPTTVLNPVIKLPEELKPETEAIIQVSESDNKAMTYTIAVVDEGLLDLTNFKTPKPHDLFYAREALGIKTWDMFGFVSDVYAGSLSRILAIGGDGELQASENPLNEANRFKPMVRFMGPFYVEKGTTNSHKIEIPNYVGSVRTMVIAGQDGAYGQTEITTPVRKPVMVLATLPRILGPGETVDLPVNVFAMKESIRDVQVKVETNDLFEVVESSTTKSVQFYEPGDELITFKLKTKPAIGVGKVRVEVTSGNEQAYHEIEIAVRNPNQPFIDIKSKAIEEASEWEVFFDPQGMEGTNSATLEISRIPPIDFGRRLNYLIRYPHGCIEQTTSSVFPQLFVADVMEIDSSQKLDIQRNVNEAIKRIERFMTSSGGLAYWPGQEDPSSWGTNYAYHFLLEAQKKGYYVPSNLINRINRFQQRRARMWTDNGDYGRSDLIQAYRLYSLALANSADMGSMNRLREKNDISNQAKWRLAAAYVLAGQPEAGNDLVKGSTTQVEEYRELSRSYGSSLRDRSMILETVSLLGRTEDASLIARDISQELSSSKWLSTQTTAYGLIAISKFLEQSNASGDINATYSLNGRRGGKIDSRAFITRLDLKMSEINENKLVLKNVSEGTLFARLILKGTPLLGDDITKSNSISQKVRYMNLDGETIDPKEIEQGSDFIAEITIANPGLRGDYQELALSQIFPSGWEIRNTRMDDESFVEPTANFEYQDIRDDRIYTYFDLNANSSKTFRVQLNASYAGRFYLPSINTSAMYDETISARNAGMWVEIVAVE
jgi:hypothetical protein